MPRVDLAVAQANELPVSPEVLSLDPVLVGLDPVTDVRLGITGNGEEKLIAQLAESMKANGQAQPILVRKDPAGGSFNVIAGRRRLVAAALAKININAVEIDCDDETARRLAFEENYRRKQMSPVEFALNISHARKHNGLATPSLAKYFQVSPAQITQMEKLLSLPQEIQDQVHAGTLAVDAAFTLEKVSPSVRGDVMEIAKEKAKAEKKERIPPTPEQKSVFKSVAEAAKHDRERKKAEAEAAKPAKVQTKHVLAAARETETLQGKKIRNRNELLAGLEALQGPDIPEVMNKFIEYVVWTYATGDAASDTGLRSRWNEIAYGVEKAEKRHGESSKGKKAAVTGKGGPAHRAQKDARKSAVAKAKKKK